MSGSTPPTLQDIADAARVSRTTVSLALRNHPKISAPVRQRIQALARRLGYRPNPLIAAHMASLRARYPQFTGQCIAFACKHSLAEIRNETMRAVGPLWRYYCGARDRADELGYRLQFFNLAEPEMTPQRAAQILRARGIRGLVIAPLSEGPGVADVALDWDDFALATIEHVFLRPELHKACNDGFSTIGRTIQRLLDDGHRRIGIAMHCRMDDHVNHQWLAGYAAYQALAPARYRIPHYITADWQGAPFLRWFRRWRPDAVITINEDIVEWLRAESVAVPETVTCVTLYWRETRAFLAGYYQNHEAIASGAVDLVAAQLTRNERGLPERSKTMLIQADWREGTTYRSRTPAPGNGAQPRVWTWITG